MIADAAPSSAAAGATLTQLPRTGADHRHSGPYGRGGYFVSAAIPGSTWRVVLTTTQSSLFSSVSGARKWLPWAIYTAFALVALGFLLLLRRLLASGAALARANAELATSNSRLQSTNELLRHAAELSRSNAELEQFASIASHDLQEPLRKVQTFAAQLNAKEAQNLSEQGQDFLRRMSDAAGRMRNLIDDLLVFSRVSTQGHPFTTVNLGHVISQVLVDLEVSIEESRALVTVGLMPTIEADPLQMRQLLPEPARQRAEVPPSGRHPGAARRGHARRPHRPGHGARQRDRLRRRSTPPASSVPSSACTAHVRIRARGSGWRCVARSSSAITAPSPPIGELDHGAAFTVRLPVTPA